MSDYISLWYTSEDDLQLYAREYPGPEEPFSLLCLHGLSRNSADFEGLCGILAGDYHMLAPDQRGRGLSDHDPNPERYQVPVYADDMVTLLTRSHIRRAVLVGTSMGGLIAMQLLAARPDLVAGVILNDIGAVVESAGLARIQGYVGKQKTPEDWGEAAAQARSLNAQAFPDFSDDDWQRFAHRLYREDDDGRPVLAYDPMIAVPAGNQTEAPRAMDLWSLFETVPPVPKLVIRGALSDILSAECVHQMEAKLPALESVEIPNRGHAPLLDEPEAVAAIRDFLDRLAE